jgi:cobyrinic acid a,c-diamide synthase
MPGVIVAAPGSGQGKTTLTLGLLAALRRAGRAVAGAKAGPDYIDPAFHAAASGRPAFNLDCWAMRPVTLARLVAAIERSADLVVCEGVMGLFDGIGPRGIGSTADLAAATGWPVVLVLDVRGQAASAAATLAGFVHHRADIAIAGVIFNRVGGARHAELVSAAVRQCLPHVAILGTVPRAEALALPERHLGLVQAGEHADLGQFLDRAADHVACHVDLDRLASLARPARVDAHTDDLPATGIPPLGQRIAVARDTAFAFAYPAMLESWRAAGAELLAFSPLADEAPGSSADAIYLPGGYPELHGGRLAGNRTFLDGLRTAAARGALIHGECGGYMTLGRGLVDADGTRHAMADLLPVETSFADRRLHLGYREMTLAADVGALGGAGARFRGHEFHYAAITSENPAQPLFHARNAEGRDLGPAGCVAGRVAGSFLHLIDRWPGA